MLRSSLEYQYGMGANIGVEELFLGAAEWTSTVTEGEAQERVDLAILPSDEKWKDTYRMFQDLFADVDMSIGQILASNFTQHEISLFMLSASEILKAIQVDNTNRFRTLLQTRFRNVAPDISTKLTMLYFGLPIEPIDFSLTDMTYKMEIREPEPPRYVVDPPLHFLTAHKERNWGNEISIGREDRTYSVPVLQPQNLLSSLPADFMSSSPFQKEVIVQENRNAMLQLRGGELDEDSDWGMPDENSDWGEEDDGDLSYAASSNEDGSENVDTKESKEEKSLSRQTSNESNKVGGNFEVSEIEYDESYETVLPDSEWDNSINLYGFQGFAAFLPGDQPTYEDAVRRLLSLGPQDDTKFSIVHFDKKSNTVDIIHDAFPLGSNSTTMDYISEQDPILQPSFFIKLENESAPDHWQPSEAELAAGVSTVTWIRDEGIDQEPMGPISCCYLTFLKSNGSQVSQKGVNGWDFDQYNTYVRAAFEVLLGSPLGCFHHALFSMYSSSINCSTSSEYGITSIKSSDVELLASNCGNEPLELRCTGLDDRNEIVFVLPSYFNVSHLPRIWNSKENFSEALNIIRQMVSFAFGDSVKHLKSVRLLHGRETLGPETNRKQQYYSIPMFDDLPQNSVIHHASALSEIIADGDPFALLYPEWDEDYTSLYIQEPNGDDEAEAHVQMPSLSSTVDEFRNKVFELIQITGYKPSQAMRLTSGESFISVQPKIEDGPATTKDDAPCFFIGPKTTDEEWFRIRARIASPASVIKIIDSSKWNWRADDQETSIWGPRYGRMAEAQAAKRQKKKVKWAEMAELIQERVTSELMKPDVIRASIEDEEPVGASHSDWAQIQSRKMKTASDSEKRRKAWATQPSIFERHGLVPWPANSGIQLPINAPPSEHMLRTGPRMPLVSKAILTPTEQGELQRITWDLRNLCLNRTARCPYDGCNFAYRLNDEDTMKKHLKTFHTARKCMWCDETLYEHWDTARINRHVREKHKDELMESLGVSKASIRRFGKEGTVSIPLRRVRKRLRRTALALASEDVVVETRKPQESHHGKTPGFCDRCGRDANFFNNIERVYHDNHCKPGIFNGAKCQFCTVCGKTAWLSAADAQKGDKSDRQLIHCSHKVDDTNGPHCSRCGFNMSRLPQDGRDLHQKGCKGFGALSGQFCLYCGEEFRDTETQADWNKNKAHMIACFKNNPNAVGVLEEPEMAAFNQQQNNLRLQINAVISDAVISEEEKGQNRKDRDIDGGNDEEPSQAKSAKRPKATALGKKTADCSAESISTALQETIQETTANLDISNPQISSSDTGRHSQETLRSILRQSIAESPQGEPSPKPSLEAPDNASQQKFSSRLPSQRPSLDLPSKESEKEPDFESRAESPLFVSSSSSEAGSDTGSLFGEDVEQDAQQSDGEESEDELLTDPSKSKRRKPRGRKRKRHGDGNYQFASEDNGDSETDEEGQRSRPPRRSPSPNWRRMLGPEDPKFEPSEEFYCSKCFRKAPKNQKRDRSPLGRKSEIELHHDPGRCCGIRRGIGSTKRLPNRSGWIPASLMPKPLSTLRGRFIRRFPVYARTLYPLNATNANGSYYRSDPNNESNSAWWSIPWPPFRGPSPLPSGWEAPDVIDVPITGKARHQFQLKAVPDPTYRQGNGVQYSEDEDENDAESDKDTNGKRKRKGRTATAKKSRKTTTDAETAATPRQVKKRAPKAVKSQAALLHKEAQQFMEGEAFTRRSTRKRQKTAKE